jgi:hypothetical protein
MLERWADKLDERKLILDFIQQVAEDNDDEVELLDINMEKALDKFHGIDQRQLEAERRQLLKEAQDADAGG